jgi:hypothetical protein
MWCHNPEDQGMFSSLMELSAITKRVHGKPMHTLTPFLSLSLSLSLVQQPKSGLGYLTLEVSRSHN